MKKTHRIDWFFDETPWQTAPFVETPEGYLKGRACVTCIGVFTYRNADGTVTNELRLPEEVMNSDSLATLEGKPLTNDHPMFGVDASTAKLLQVGSVFKVDNDPYKVYCDIMITDAQAVADVKAGKRELSCGYDCEVEEAEGVHGGVGFNRIQRNIRYNHVALVDKARAGDDARLRMDGAGVMMNSVMGTGKTSTTTQGEPTMITRKIDGQEVQADALVLAKLDATTAQVETLNLEKTKLDSALVAKGSELETLTGKLDAAEKQVKDLSKEIEGLKDPVHLDSAIAGRVALRVALLKHADRFEVEVKDDASDLDIKKALVLKDDPEAKLDGKSAEYIEARLDAALVSLGKTAAATGTRRMADGAVDTTKEGELTPLQKADAAYRKSLADAHRTTADKEA